MKISFGEMLRHMRLEKGVDAGVLCAGLGSLGMMSYWENGRTEPDVLLLECFMERLGVSPELFTVMVTKGAYEYLRWKSAVREAIEERDCGKLEKLLESEVTEKSYCNRRLEEQFLLYARGISEGIKGNYKIAAEMLKDAAGRTIPNFEKLERENMLLSATEIHIVLLYLYYAVLENVIDVSKGINFFHSLEDYISGEMLGMLMKARMYPKLCCIGLTLFGNVLPEEEQIEYCEKALDYMRSDLSFYEITAVLRMYIPLLEKSESPKAVVYKKQYEVFENLFMEVGMETTFYAERFCVRRPKLYMLNEYLYVKRNEKELTQEALSEGICEPETYSRIETGKRAPSRQNLNKLAERLEMGWCFYNAELDTVDSEAMELRMQQREALIYGENAKSLELLQQLENRIDMELVQNIQYIKTNEFISKVRLNIISAEETFEKLKNLLCLSKGEEIAGENLVYYTQTELEIISYMAQQLESMERYEEGIHYLENVLRQMKKGRIDIKSQWLGFEFMLRMLNSLYFKAQKYPEAIAIAKYVKEENIKRARGDNLVETLDALADAYEHMGIQYKESYQKLYRYAYYVADFYKMQKCTEFIDEYYRMNFQREISWYDPTVLV